MLNMFDILINTMIIRVDTLIITLTSDLALGKASLCSHLLCIVMDGIGSKKTSTLTVYCTDKHFNHKIECNAVLTFLNSCNEIIK